MLHPTRLPVHKLHTRLDPAKLPWSSSRDIPFRKLEKNILKTFQPRVFHALEVALSLHDNNFHIYLSGDNELGRTYLLKSFLKSVAETFPTPEDQVYVYNFSRPDLPVLLKMPAGQGKIFAGIVQTLIADISNHYKERLETPEFMQKYFELTQKFGESKSVILTKLSEAAKKKGFSLEMDDESNYCLSPILNSDKKHGSMRAQTKAVEKYEITCREQTAAKNIIRNISDLDKHQKEFQEAEKDLRKKVMEETLNSIFSSAKKKILKHCPSDDIYDYLNELQADILRNTDYFAGLYNQNDDSGENGFENRYKVNIFVDNSSLKGAPIVIEDNPSLQNLMGTIEREADFNTQTPDIALIRSGSLHKANGGFLILHVEALMRHPYAWESLLCALRTGKASFEDTSENSETSVRFKAFHPTSHDLNLKVILIGDEEYFETLLEREEIFSKLFSLKAHMRDNVERSQVNIRYYLAQIAKIASESSSLPLGGDALAWLVDLGSHLSEDQNKLSLKFPLLKKIIQEADAIARIQKNQDISPSILEKAYSNKVWREGLVEEEFLEEYAKDRIKLPTSGKAVGQVNGLTVTWTGNLEFGLPQRISCTVGVGHEGIIDLEREVDFGGPIHSKAIMILKSYLTDLFARKKPLVLSASLYFEQSYCDIDGDSASGAELIALLSALAEVPVRLDLAFTGAISHSGQIIPVGGVSKKIEGFYKICSQRGLTGTQGVIIPHDNVPQLILSKPVLTSIEENKFSVYSVRTMEEAIYLLTGLEAGKRRKNGTFTPGSLFDLVDRKLDALGYHAQNAFKRSRG